MPSTSVAGQTGNDGPAPGGGPRPPGSSHSDGGTSVDDALDRDPSTTVREGSQDVGNCTRYANSDYYGEKCADSTSTTGRTWREILDGQPFPDCQVTPLPADMTPPLPPRGQAGTWMLHVCHDNVTIDGIVPGETLRRRAELFFYAAGSLVPALTPEQLTVFSTLTSSYPTPVVVFGPVHPPRVGVTTTFWLAAPPGTARRTTITTATGQTLNTLVDTATGDNGTPFRAYVTQTILFPGTSPNEDPVMCPGAGVPQPDTVRPTAGQPCTYMYQRSSAHLPDQLYNLTVEAVWTVEFQNPDGTWTPLNSAAPTTTLFRTPVHEIQTVTTG
jgi:hypothetical protein